MAKTYLQRVKKERKKLNKKIIKLQDFIDSDEFETHLELQQNLLIVQVTVMATYSNILGTRLDLEKPSVTVKITDAESDQSWQ